MRENFVSNFSEKFQAILHENNFIEKKIGCSQKTSEKKKIQVIIYKKKSEKFSQTTLDKKYLKNVCGSIFIKNKCRVNFSTRHFEQLKFKKKI